MGRWRNWLLALFCAVMVLSPTLADARAGGSFRGGSSSYSSSGTSGWSSPGYGYSNPNSAYAYNRNTSFAQRHPFLTGMAGWFFASWLGSLLFPHWGMGLGFGGAFHSLISWLLIIFAISWLLRWFRRGGAPVASPYMRGGDAPMFGGFGNDQPPRRDVAIRDIAVDAHDQAAFEAILKAVQDAWSKGDLRAIGHYVTPEMYAYFRDHLATYASQGAANRVEQVELINGDVRQAWDDGRQEYATCLLHWRALDYTHRLDRTEGAPGWLVEGDPQHPTEAQEIWTFARRPGSHWLLSAIEQV